VSILNSLHNNLIFRKNLLLLERMRPIQFRLVVRWLEQQEMLDFSIVKSGKFFWIKTSDYVFPDSNCYIDQNKSVSPWLLLVLGFGLGLGVGDLEKKYPKARKIIIFEPEIKVFVAAMMHQDQERIFSNPKLAFVLGRVPMETVMQFREALPASTFALAGSLGVVIHSGAFEVFGKEYKNIAADISKSIDMFFRNLGNSIEDTLLGVKQYALNTWSVVCSLSLESLFNKYKGLPVIVVSAGPSLDKNIHLLDRVKGKMPILCNDVVLPKLLKRGLVPDVVCALERGYIVYEQWFSKVADKTEDILLVAPAVVTPEVFGTFRGPKILVSKIGLPLDETLAGLFAMDKMQTGASVAHLCFNVAQVLGGDPIILIGQDLAYGEDGLTHSEDVTGTTTQEVASMYKTNTDISEVPGALGGTVKTNPWWLLFLRHLEALVAACSAKVIDATEGGALILGTEVSPLEKVIETYLPKEPFAPLRSFLEPPEGAVVKAKMERLRQKSQEIEKKYACSLKCFDSIDALVEKTLSPGLSLSKRIAFAELVGKELDLLREGYPDVFQMIQSFVFSMIVEFTAKDFDFESLEFRSRWQKLHKEFTEAARVALDFLKKYLLWMRSAAEIAIEVLEEEGEENSFMRTCLNYKRDWRLVRHEPSLKELEEALRMSIEQKKRSFFEEPRQLFPEWWRRIEDPEVLRLLGRAFLRWELHDLAVPILQKAADALSEDASIWVDLGVAYGEYDVLRDFEISKSLEAFYRALAIDPHNVEAREGLRVVAGRVVALYKSAMDSRDALGIGDAMLRAMRCNVADCYGVLEKYEDALEHYRRIFLDDDPSTWEDPERLMNMILCLEKVNALAEAELWAARLRSVMERMNRYYLYALWNLLSFYARRQSWEAYAGLFEWMCRHPALAERALRHRAMVDEETKELETFLGTQDCLGNADTK